MATQPAQLVALQGRFCRRVAGQLVPGVPL